MKESTLPQDELTLKEINNYLRQLRYFISYVAVHYLKGVRQHRLLMFTVALVVVAITVYLSRFSTMGFEAKATYTYNSLQKKVYGEMADKLDNLVQTHAYDKLAALLRISSVEVAKIQKIKAVNIFNSLLSEDMAENSSQKLFYIEIHARDSKVFANIDKAIEVYFNSNIAVKEIAARQTAEIRHGIAYREVERGMVDSLIRAYSKSLDKPVVSSYPSAAPSFDAVQLLEKGEKISTELADMQLYLKDHRSVRMQDGFLVSPNLPKPSLLKALLVAVGSFILVSAFILLILSLAKNDRHVA